MVSATLKTVKSLILNTLHGAPKHTENLTRQDVTAETLTTTLINTDK